MTNGVKFTVNVYEECSFDKIFLMKDAHERHLNRHSRRHGSELKKLVSNMQFSMLSGYLKCHGH